MTQKPRSVLAVGLYVNPPAGQGNFFFCGKFVSTASLRPAHLPSLQAQTAASATPAVKKHLNRPHLTINSPFVQANDPPLPRTLCNGYATEVSGFSCECVCVCVCVLPETGYIHFFALSSFTTYLILLIRRVGCASPVCIPIASGVSKTNLQVNSHV